MERQIQNLEIKQQTIPFSLLMLFIIVFAIGYTANSVAAAGDELIVIESLVNVRSAPSNDSEPLLRLKQDRKVTEIQRQGNWVEVEMHRDGISTGWIHGSLLSKAETNTTEARNTISPTRFDNFMQRFNNHNEVIKKQHGEIYFTEAKSKSRSEIEVIATQAWINSDIEVRNNTLSEIFNLWSDVVPVGTSISVQVLDEQGEKYTIMLR
jgi:uncharacterized protein YgiM (DUF1202 family)